ncbi:hypothetical protein FQV39_32880 (plasmid) [Bosea sp. F3-2]|uniref:Zn-ribbon domain-containing OB-fold protein n=1 Tax=Bosea sp. F3-2 TaxID=2599640 RepID=UPI0011EE2F99|nr:OB-fold domain-containing protein [Bosea sp. F3-2]QEL27400.1 hypothetical protein FQV39_32880 [Bosea sp. F3-2]
MSLPEAYAKPVPVPDPDSAPFWAGCREQRLMIQHCDDCSRHQFPPSNICAHCGSGRLSWKQASGAGKVFSWIVVRHPVPKPVYVDDVPYVVALIELAEGVRMPSNIVGCAPEDVVADMPLKVAFKQVTEEVVLPLFEPA